MPIVKCQVWQCGMPIDRPWHRRLILIRYDFGLKMSERSLSHENNAYRVAEESGKFNVNDPSDRSILAFRDAASAAHYAALLNQAYKQGYQAGYRHAKTSEH